MRGWAGRRRVSHGPAFAPRSFPVTARSFSRHRGRPIRTRRSSSDGALPSGQPLGGQATKPRYARMIASRDGSLVALWEADDGPKPVGPVHFGRLTIRRAADG